MKKLLSLCQSQQNPKHGYPLTPEFSCTWNGQRTLRRWPAKTMDSPRDSNMERLSQAHRLTLRPAPGLGSTHRAVCPGMAGLPHPLPSGHDCLPETQGSRSSNMGCCMLLCSLRLPLLLHRVPPRSSVQLHQSSPGQVPRGTVVGQPLLLSQHPSSNLSAAGASQTMHTKGTGVILKFLICRVD